MNDTAPANVRTPGEAVFFFGSLALQRGGLTRAVLSRLRLYAEAGIKVRLLITEHRAREKEIEAQLREHWELPDSVEVRYFWRDAAPGGGGAPADPLATAEEEPGLTTFADVTARRKVLRCYRDGLLVKSKHFDKAGKLARIDHHDRARRVMSQEHYDENERLVRIDELNPEIGKALLRRWYDRSGACWLTSWLTPHGTPSTAVRHSPAPAAYDKGECVAEWADKVLADAAAPVVFSDSRTMDRAVMAMKHPRVRKVAVMHNCHTAKPYRADDATKTNWLPLLENTDEFDAIVALTQQQHDDIVPRYGAKNVTVINHPTPPLPDVSVEREPGLLVTVTRLDEQKQLDHAIRAFASAAKRAPTARFDIYGKGPAESDLWALVQELELTDRIRFRGFTDRPLEKFAGATASVLSSRYEGFGLVITESMGVGTPVVSYDINYGPAELIRHEVDGLLVPPGDVDALGDAMVRVLGDPEYAARLGKRAREVKERFSAERWGREWTELVTRLVGPA